MSEELSELKARMRTYAKRTHETGAADPPWPCEVMRLLDELDRLEAACAAKDEALQAIGRNHLRPHEHRHGGTVKACNDALSPDAGSDLLNRLEKAEQRAEEATNEWAKAYNRQCNELHDWKRRAEAAEKRAGTLANRLTEVGERAEAAEADLDKWQARAEAAVADRLAEQRKRWKRDEDIAAARERAKRLEEAEARAKEANSRAEDWADKAGRSAGALNMEANLRREWKQRAKAAEQLADDAEAKLADEQKARRLAERAFSAGHAMWSVWRTRAEAAGRRYGELHDALAGGDHGHTTRCNGAQFWRSVAAGIGGRGWAYAASFLKRVAEVLARHERESKEAGDGAEEAQSVARAADGA